MVHQQSPKSLMRRKARRYILEHAYHDPKRAETVSLTTSSDLFAELGESPIEILRGLVLTDSRGEGSFQQPEGGEI